MKKMCQENIELLAQNNAENKQNQKSILLVNVCKVLNYYMKLLPGYKSFYKILVPRPLCYKGVYVYVCVCTGAHG